MDLGLWTGALYKKTLNHKLVQVQSTIHNYVYSQNCDNLSSWEKPNPYQLSNISVMNKCDNSDMSNISLTQLHYDCTRHVQDITTLSLPLSIHPTLSA
jgi:hypothetical protein